MPRLRSCAVALTALLLSGAGCAGAGNHAAGSGTDAGGTAGSGTAGTGTRVTPPPGAGSAPDESPVASGATSTVPRGHAGITLSEASTGATVTIHLGQQIRLRLRGSWTTPRAVTRPGITAEVLPLRTDESAGYPARRPATATFTAIRPGGAQIIAETDASCLHTMPRCLVAQRQFVVTVRVLPHPGTGAGPLPVPAPS